MRKWIYILIMIASVHCREEYNVTPATNGEGVLVVEGTLNANGRTIINLSRTTRLSDERIAFESGAALFIEGETSGVVFPLFETAQGRYESESLVFNESDKYRLKIHTADNRQYASDFKNFIITPVIDSVSWIQDGEGVHIYLSSHGDANSSPYYKWDYEETWEYKSSFRSIIEFEATNDPNGYPYRLVYFDPIFHQINDSIFTCWQNRNSTSINIASTQSLGTNVLFHEILSYPPASIELSHLYSINVKQIALSRDGYDFYTKMEKNTESLGSIFDAQPSEISGNIKCLTDPSELVIGYVEFSTLESKRIFISNTQLTDWGYDQGCLVFHGNDSIYPTYPFPNSPEIFEKIIEKRLRPTAPVETRNGAIVTFIVEELPCVDCTVRGGYHIKPDFWP